MKFSLSAILDTIDEAMNYLGIQLLKLPTYRIYNVLITPKIQIGTFFAFLFLGGITALNLTQAGEGHDHGGGAEAEALGSDTSALLNEQFVQPKSVNVDSIANQSYPGTIMSDEYGSVFSSREGIITTLHVNLGDSVKKGQTVASVSSAGNTPEIIALIASQRAGVAIAQGQLEGSRKVVAYLDGKTTQTGTGVSLEEMYAQQKKAIDISIDTQKQQLLVKIDNITKQLEAKGQLVEASKLSNQATIQGNEEKIRSKEKELLTSIDSAVSTLVGIFLDGNVRNISNNQNTRLQKSYISSLNTAEKYKLEGYLTQLVSQYPFQQKSYSEIIALSELVELAVKQAVTVLSYSQAGDDYHIEQLNADKQTLIALYGGENNGIAGIATIKSRAKELEKEILGSNLIASGNILVANAEVASLQQEIALLQNEVKLLDAQKNKELAKLDGEKGVKNFEVGFEYQKQVLELNRILIEAQKEVLTAESTVKAYQNALGAVESTAKTTTVVAPFDGIISRKNVVVGQSIEPTTPIFDIVGAASRTDAFVRFEVPVNEYAKIKEGNTLQVSLPGASETISARVARIAQSVNQNSQTVTVEGDFVGGVALPLGTSVRVSGQGLSGESVVGIPNSAVFALEDGSMIVYKVLPNDTLKQWKVTVASQDADMSYIQGGLKPSDMLVLHADDPQWSDGKKVEAKKETPGTEEHKESDGHADH